VRRRPNARAEATCSERPQFDQVAVANPTHMRNGSAVRAPLRASRH
jgi:hypothetical protein